MKFTTSNDAELWCDGVLDWEWGGNANHEDFCSYVWARHNEPEYQNLVTDDGDDDARDALLFDYLKSVSENPADYSIRDPR